MRALFSIAVMGSLRGAFADCTIKATFFPDDPSRTGYMSFLSVPDRIHVYSKSYSPGSCMSFQDYAAGPPQAHYKDVTATCVGDTMDISIWERTNKDQSCAGSPDEVHHNATSKDKTLYIGTNEYWQLSCQNCGGGSLYHSRPIVGAAKQLSEEQAQATDRRVADGEQENERLSAKLKAVTEKKEKAKEEGAGELKRLEQEKKEKWKAIKEQKAKLLKSRKELKAASAKPIPAEPDGGQQIPVTPAKQQKGKSLVSPAAKKLKGGNKTAMKGGKK